MQSLALSCWNNHRPSLILLTVFSVMRFSPGTRLGGVLCPWSEIFVLPEVGRRGTQQTGVDNEIIFNAGLPHVDDEIVN